MTSRPWPSEREKAALWRPRLDSDRPLQLLDQARRRRPSCYAVSGRKAAHSRIDDVVTAVPRLDEANLQAICDILGETATGLSGSQIARYLSECGIHDPYPSMTKRARLYEALAQRQRSDRHATSVLRFIQHAVKPVRHTTTRNVFESRRSQLNHVLAFSALTLGEDGRLRRRAKAAQTLSQADAAASKLRRTLRERQVHGDVLRFCRAELVGDNYFHAVFEATKSVADKLRDKAGLTSDGAALVDDALGIGKADYPRLAFNRLSTENERSEHRGLATLIKGVFGAFRNTTAHAPKIHWAVTEQDALDILTTLSLVHRRLDAAIRTHMR